MFEYFLALAGINLLAVVWERTYVALTIFTFGLAYAVLLVIHSVAWCICWAISPITRWIPTWRIHVDHAENLSK